MTSAALNIKAGRSEARAVPCSPAARPESDNSFLYFSLASIVSLISSSTSARGREYCSREDSIIFARLSTGEVGMERVVAEKAGTFSPLIIIEIMKLRLFIWIRSDSSKVGSNCLTRTGASSAETRKEIVVPTLPKTASRTESVIWAVYWLATVRLRPYFRASERMTAKDSGAKFWNSST